MLRCVEGCHIFGLLLLWRFLGRGVGYHLRNEIWFNQNSSLQETCADVLDRDAVLASLFNNLLLYRQSNPVLLFSAFDPATITVEIDTVSRWHEFRRSVPFYLL